MSRAPTPGAAAPAVGAGLAAGAAAGPDGGAAAGVGVGAEAGVAGPLCGAGWLAGAGGASGRWRDIADRVELAERLSSLIRAAIDSRVVVRAGVDSGSWGVAAPGASVGAACAP